MFNKVQKFLGVGHYDETDAAAINLQNAWFERRKRLLQRRCGPLLQSPNQDDTDAYENLVTILNDLLSKPKRVFGSGLVGKLLLRKFKKDLANYQGGDITHIFNDRRPFFTYWITIVQILIMIIGITTYGFGPFGLTKSVIQDRVFVSSLNYNQESYLEIDNIWLGPRPADLILQGALFTPCMRKDYRIYEKIKLDMEEEKHTGCCVRADQSGCLQTTKEDCLSKWLSWNETNTNDPPPHMYSTRQARTSGPVCGQDPNFCITPASIYPFEWPDDITKWPICQKKHHTFKAMHHMSCELTGRPCCIGIFGQCRITTSEHCQFLKGTFHSEANLCSQVSCMDDVCGMIPFFSKDNPNQFYRLATALFVHAGIFHLAFTVILQYYIMRDIERFLGTNRIAIIYIVSGSTGYLASATFVPYHTQVGPSGSHFALLACLVAETVNSWEYLENPIRSILKFFGLAFALFVVGLLPWIDNYAHIFGFITGLALSLALTPYLAPLTEYSRKMKIIQIMSCLAFVVVLNIVLALAFYVYPVYCPWCKYLDCLPIYPDWCENQDIEVPRLEKF